MSQTAAAIQTDVPRAQSERCFRSFTSVGMVRMYMKWKKTSTATTAPKWIRPCSLMFLISLSFRVRLDLLACKGQRTCYNCRCAFCLYLVLIPECETCRKSWWAQNRRKAGRSCTWEAPGCCSVRFFCRSSPGRSWCSAWWWTRSLHRKECDAAQSLRPQTPPAWRRHVGNVPRGEPTRSRKSLFTCQDMKGSHLNVARVQKPVRKQSQGIFTKEML